MSSFSCLDARKGSEKKIKASAKAGEVWPGTRQTSCFRQELRYWANLAGVPDAPRGLVVPLAILEELTEELGLGLLVFGELLDGEDLLETLDVFLL